MHRIKINPKPQIRQQRLARRVAQRHVDDICRERRDQHVEAQAAETGPCVRGPDDAVVVAVEEGAVLLQDGLVLVARGIVVLGGGAVGAFGGGGDVGTGDAGVDKFAAGGWDVRFAFFGDGDAGEGDGEVDGLVLRFAICWSGFVGGFFEADHCDILLWSCVNPAGSQASTSRCLEMISTDANYDKCPAKAHVIHQ